MAIEARAAQLPKATGGPMTLPHQNVVENFEQKHYDFSDPCESLALCWATCGLAGPCTNRAVDLTHEELEVTMSNWCMQNTKRIPYAALDGVDVDEACCGVCLQVDDVGSACCGFGAKEVREITRELEQRIEKRGNIAQLKVKPP